ncbi:hypothetical protein THTE_4075 [Thermogutta terrifontis]|uniref:Uncharacterized protein n=1 Tax=Thermogutta terrifontis TaxID=1331910 RepID=A0A286RL36_9BACT|nr:hypothetical protein [Thermogutta terrifontis]ASV76676.1 hypothetical protein THTE_4075 [Thermogutta terrifontis]
MRWVDRLESCTGQIATGEIPELPEVKVAKRFIEEQIRYRPKHMRLPHKGMRFRSLSDVALKTLVYFDLSPDGRALFSMPIKDYIVNPSIVLILPYEPDHSISVACRLIPEKYKELECHVVEKSMRDDPNYLGYAFAVSYEQLHIDFEWLGKVEPTDDDVRNG